VSTLAEPEADGPYAHFNHSVGATVGGAYEGGGMARLGAGPEAVAKAIEKAIRRPRSRVPVTASARIMNGLRRVMPDGMWDRSMRTNFPQPKPSRRNPRRKTGMWGSCVHSLPLWRRHS
jgi:hypothetical protein